jgi:hypothetical protein
MRNNLIFIIKDKKLSTSDYNQAWFKDYLKDIEHEGEKWQLNRVSSKVSDNRRGWYFGAVLPFVKRLVPAWQELSDDQMHEVLKTEFNGFSIKDKHGRDRKYPMPVANRNADTEQFDQFILRIADWVRSNYALELPDPQSYRDLLDRGEIEGILDISS